MKNEELYNKLSTKEYANRTLIEQPLSLDAFYNKVIDGFEKAVKLASLIQQKEKELKILKDKIKPFVLEEIENGEHLDGYRLETVQSGRYDYSRNEEWLILKNRMKEIEKDMQIAYKSKGTYISEDGEVIEPAIYKSNQKSYKIIKNKEK